MLKKLFKQNTHSLLFKYLSGFGRSMNRIYENSNHNIHYNGELTILKKLAYINPQIVIDGGANIGNYSQWVHKFSSQAQIYAFEPVTETYEKMCKNVENNKQVVPINRGLFSEKMTKQIHLYTQDKHASLYEIEGVKQKPLGTIEIKLIKGDEFVKEHNIEEIDFLKLDLEGADFDALLGFEEMIKEGNVRIIQFEYGYINITSKNLLLDFYTFFSEHGYIIGKVFPKIVEFRDYEFKYEDFLGTNYIAVKKSDTEIINLLSQK